MDTNKEIEITIKDFFELSQKDGGEYQIYTPDGWQDIGFLVSDHKECYNIITQNGLELGCSFSHQLLTQDGWKTVEEIDVQNDKIQTVFGFENVVAKEYLGCKDTYDINVDGGKNRYYSSGIVSHNCGKSLTAKAIASLYQLPLLRLDFGNLFGSKMGESERRVREAMRLTEALAPAILWIDELEKALSGVQSSDQSDGGTTARVIATFLTWMQERESPIIAICTANRQEKLLPEVMRRFSEIFFVDLPRENEREQIFRALIRRNNRDPEKFNLKRLSRRTENYSGYEIEKIIENAMYRACNQKFREFTTKDIEEEIEVFKPLYDVREQEFKEMREWADGRCAFANTDG